MTNKSKIQLCALKMTNGDIYYLPADDYKRLAMRPMGWNMSTLENLMLEEAGGNIVKCDHDICTAHIVSAWKV